MRRAIACAACLSVFCAAMTAAADTWHVWADSPANGPGTAWSNAFHVIQDAVDAASSNDTVLVTNGTYNTGGAVTPGANLMNRVCITNPITVRGISGPADTFIVGASDSGWHGPNAVRGVCMMTNAVLTGFTVTGGYTRTDGGVPNRCGGGVYGVGIDAVVSNCVLTYNEAHAVGGGVAFAAVRGSTISNNRAASSGGGTSEGMIEDCTIVKNWAGYSGGGAFGGTLRGCTINSNTTQYGAGAIYGTLTNCTFSGNEASSKGGGAYYATLTGCTLSDNKASQSGGGADATTLNNCVLIGNTAANGGGAYDCTLNNCLLRANWSTDNGGGAYGCTLKNCTLSGNIAWDYGGGAHSATLLNCIAWYNSGGGDLYNTVVASNCCSPSVNHGVAGNITSAPLFVDRVNNNYRLTAVSPCVDTGNNGYAPAGTDLDGCARIVDGDGNVTATVDMGCHEYQPPPEVTITNPASDITVDSTVTNYTVQGTVDAYAVGTMWWTNHASGATGTFAASDPWSVANISLVTGPNAIEVGATNALGDQASHTVTITRPGEYAGISPVHYVAPGGGNVWPYTNWADAATSIQFAVSAASSNDTVWVTNGVYDTGSAVTPGYTLSNRVCITRPIAVRSVNGPAHTLIVGASDGGGNGPAALRGVCLMSEALLAGFTVTNGHTRTEGHSTGDRGGGGVYCHDGVAGSISNCVLTGNAADTFGGGSYYGTLINCLLTHNAADSGGGAYRGMLKNCTLSHNAADFDAGGAHSATLQNSIIWYNTAVRYGADLWSSSAASSCSPQLTPGAQGNITNAPLFVGHVNDDYQLLPLSPCLDAGSNAFVSAQEDLAGAPRITDADGDGTATVDMGCYEYQAPSVTITDPDGYLAVDAGMAAYTVGGTANPYVVGMMSWTNHASGDAGIFSATSPWIAAGIPLLAGGNLIEVSGSNAFGAVASDAVTIVRGESEHDGDSPVHYVATNGAHAWPYTNWVDAATNIQSAVNVAASGDTVLVSNGVYNSGGAAAPGHALTSRVCIMRPMVVMGVAGATNTFIVGASHSGTNGPDAVRGVYMGADALLAGFCVTNGHTGGGGWAWSDRTGGGVYCVEGALGVVSNCTLSGNAADASGGGAHRCRLENALLIGNSAVDSGGGANTCVLHNCTLIDNAANSGAGVWGGTLSECLLSGNSAGYSGGAAQGSTLDDCTLSGNAAAQHGGGARLCVLTRCTLSGNSAGNYGGGAMESTLDNSLVVSNAATYGGGVYDGVLANCTLSANTATSSGGGVYGGDVRNCIAWFNTADVAGSNLYGVVSGYSSAPELSHGSAGNITNAPLFADRLNGDYHLTSASPCVDTAHNGNAVGDTDLDGNPRIVDGYWGGTPTVDMGCYEFQPLVTITDPASDIAVAAEVTSYTVRGISDAQIIGTMWWTNQTSGATGSLNATDPWSLGSVSLVAGGNRIEVLGSNASGVVFGDAVRITRLAEDGGNSPVHYVSPDGAGIWPYTNWADAAICIQHAIVTAAARDTVLVGDGVYDTGSAVTPGHALTNRVCITRPITMRSVNGAAHTMIIGASHDGANGPGAVRGVCILTNAVLAGFTVTNGHTRTDGDASYDQSGGGLFCQLGSGAVVSNCLLSGNAAAIAGGGIRNGTLDSSLLVGNAAGDGGGAYTATLRNCTLSDNTATNRGGGAHSATLVNCIAWYNTAIGGGPDLHDVTASNSCSPDVGHAVAGNTTNVPLFADRPGGSYRLLHTSPCVDAGDNAYAQGGTDLDGYARLIDGDGDTTVTVDMGCYEYQPAGVTITQPAANASVAGDVTVHTLLGSVNPYVVGTLWWTNYASGVGGTLSAANPWTVLDVPLLPGANLIEVGASNAVGMAGSDTVTISRDIVDGGNSPVHYVSPEGAHVWPYASWADAATVIQAAVDAAGAGDTVLVSNGVYNTGGAVTPGYSLSNRVCVTRPVTLRSVNGPANTFIVGASHYGENGPGAVRAVCLMTDTLLSGFTVTNGHTRSNGVQPYDDSGGGLFCKPGVWAAISNCVFSGNGALNGGGAAYGTLDHCLLTGNTADNIGGGAVYSTLRNCLVTGNAAGTAGGGVGWGTVLNCTVVENASGGYGGGAYGCDLANSIVWYNASDPPAPDICWSDATNSCSAGSYAGPGCITNAPLFVARANGNYRLQPLSACIDAGHNGYAVGETDLDGLPRLVDGRWEWWDPTATVDMGCHEFQSLVTITDPTSDITVDGQVTNITLHGSIGAQVTGEMSWWNYAAGEGGYFDASNPWTVEGVRLLPGRNRMAVFGSGTPAYLLNFVDEVVVTRLAEDAGDSSVHYVAPGGANVWPYTNWADAATCVQYAVAAASSNDTVLVANGVYSSGGAVTPGHSLSNRVCITRPMTVRSVNGAAHTTIVGAPSLRAVCITADAVLAGFTITNGHTRADGDPAYDRSGGGLFCAVGSAVMVSNCVLTGNAAAAAGGGAHGGTLNNSLLIGNSAHDGGGAWGATLRNCTLSGNTATNHGGGAHSATVLNTIAWYNTAGGEGTDLYAGAATNACSPDVSVGTAGNITNAPYFADRLGGDYRLLETSPCIDAGDNSFAPAGVDLDGAPRLLDGDGDLTATVDMGCYEVQPPEIEITVPAADVAVPEGTASYTVRGTINPYVVGTMWWTNHASGAAGTFAASDAWTVPGIPLVDRENRIDILGSNSVGVIAFDSVTVTRLLEYVGPSPVHYVSPQGGNLWPYTNWLQAATEIQSAVATASAGDTVLVSNGVYNAGGAPKPGSFITNRVCITRSLTVRSINGPAHTVIVGAGDPLTGGSGPGAIRGVYAGADIELAGFTVINGETWQADYAGNERRGGGLRCEDGVTATVSNCVFSGCAAKFGGGVYGGNLTDCTLIGNSAWQGGGANQSTLTRCTLGANSAYGTSAGGGAFQCTLRTCTVTSNSAYMGGGTYYSALENSLVVRNTCEWKGGGAYGGSLVNCTVVDNGAGSDGAGVYGAALTNCIAWLNRGPMPSEIANSWAHNTCSPDVSPGVDGNITDWPWFVAEYWGNYRLQARSPCIDAGTNSAAPWAADLDGRPRIADGNLDGSSIVDMGCYEYPKPPSVTITEPADDITVGHDVTNYVLRGSINAEVTGLLWHVGAGPDTALVVADPWATTISLAQGESVVTVWCTNAYGAQASAEVTITRIGLDLASSPVHYVATNGANIWPYTSWATAATNIQDAIYTANGWTFSWDTVWVSNGVYSTGGALTPGHGLSNRVCITRAIALRSVNGPLHTVIVGASDSGTNGPAAVRGICILARTTLSGFTISNGYTRADGDAAYDQSGGGIFSEDGNMTVISNCVLTANSAAVSGGGVRGAIYLYGSLVTGNSAGDGGGAMGCTLRGCTLSGNVATSQGGGAHSATLMNTIAWHNAAGGAGTNLHDCTALYSCSPDVNPGTDGNTTNAPLFVNPAGGDYRLKTASPCIDTGNNGYVVQSTDLDAYARVVDGDGDGTPTVDMGCYEYRGPEITITDPISTISVSDVVTSFTVRGTINTYVVGTMWWTNHAAGVSGTLAAASEWTVANIPLVERDNLIEILGSNAVGVVTSDVVTITRQAEHIGNSPIHYVAIGGGHVWPYTNWTDAAVEIQAAVAAASSNELVLVGDGVYSVGGAITPGYAVTNRVCITRPMTVRSVNGPGNTVILGASDGGANGPAAVRGVCITTDAVLTGFTISNGHTRNTGSWPGDYAGGGFFCEFGVGAVLSNCVLSGNSAYAGGGTYAGILNGCTLSANIATSSGGGTYLGKLRDCTLEGNTAETGGGGFYCWMTNCTLLGNTGTDNGGGANFSTLERCLLHDNHATDGGGAFDSTLGRCVVSNNQATAEGGGGYSGTLDGCLVVGNSAGSKGGGLSYSDARNCTVVGNAATGWYGTGGGTYYCDLWNGIIWYNTASSLGPDTYSGTAENSCSPGISLGDGNTRSEPAFIAGSYRLQGSSPCVDTGSNAAMLPGADLDGIPRPLDGDNNTVNTVDMGCYELLNRAADSDGDTMADGWEDDHGLNMTDASDASGNPDGDPHDNRQEFVADTDPNDPASYLRVVAVSNLPLPTVYFESSSNRVYTMDGCPSLVDGVWTNVPGAGPRMGAGGSDAMQDTNQPPEGPFYRLEVVRP